MVVGIFWVVVSGDAYILSCGRLILDSAGW